VPSAGWKMEEYDIATESKREDPYPSLFEVKGVCIILVRKVSENLVREFDQLFYPTPIWSTSKLLSEAIPLILFTSKHSLNCLSPSSSSYLFIITIYY